MLQHCWDMFHFFESQNQKNYYQGTLSLAIFCQVVWMLAVGNQVLQTFLSPAHQQPQSQWQPRPCQAKRPHFFRSLQFLPHGLLLSSLLIRICFVKITTKYFHFYCCFISKCCFFYTQFKKGKLYCDSQRQKFYQWILGSIDSLPC